MAMARIKEKIENSSDVRPSTKIERDEALDPRLVYTWWERNFDEAFTRQSRQATGRSYSNLSLLLCDSYVFFCSNL